MDTVTQMLLGGAVAQLGFRRRLGRRAVPVGLALGLVPDLDIVVRWVAGPVPYWAHHRGITHSFLFGPIVGPAFGWLASRLERRRKPQDPALAAPGRLHAWMWLGVAALVTHPLIDLFTSYGTMLLSPLDSTRFAIDALPIVDPVYSLALILALAIGAFLRPARASVAAGLALLFVTLYTFGGWAIGERIRQEAVRQIGREAQVNAYPLLFQPYYRRVLAMTDTEARVGYYSILAPSTIEWTTYPLATSPAIEAVRASPEGRVFDWFAMDKVLWRESEPAADGTRTVEGLDLRYGMPLNEPSLWGLRARVAADGRLLDVPDAFSTPRTADADAWAGYWRAITGR